MRVALKVKTATSIGSEFALPPVETSVQRSSDVALRWLEAFHAGLAFVEGGAEDKSRFLRESPFHFFRALPGLFHADLRDTYRDFAQLGGVGAPRTLIVGDPHLGNFGTVRDADGNAFWTVNDFDLAGPGRVEWDLARLSVSVWLVGLQHGLEKKTLCAWVAALGTAYFDALATADVPSAGRTDASARAPVRALVKAASKRSRKDFLRDWLEPDAPRFKRSQKLRSVSAETRVEVEAALSRYREELPAGVDVGRPLRVLDVASRVSGGSTRGLPRWVALVERATEGKQPLILELKTGLPPALMDANGAMVSTHPELLVERQRQMLPLVGPFVGTAHVAGVPMLVRELEPQRDSIDPLELEDPKQLLRLATEAAAVLAEVHLLGSNAPGRLQSWATLERAAACRALLALTETYAEQVLNDFAAYRVRAAPPRMDQDQFVR